MILEQQILLWPLWKVVSLKSLQTLKEKNNALNCCLYKKRELLVGQLDKRQAVINPENTFYSVNRFIGRKTNEMPNELRQVSYNVVQTEDFIKLDCPFLGKQFATEEISAQVLRKLTEDASKYLG